MKVKVAAFDDLRTAEKEQEQAESKTTLPPSPCWREPAIIVLRDSLASLPMKILSISRPIVNLNMYARILSRFFLLVRDGVNGIR